MQEHFPCPICGNSLIVGQEFCPHCGFRLTYLCTRCDNIVETNLKFCTKCGAPLAWGETAPATAEDVPEEAESALSDEPLKAVLDRISDTEIRSLASSFVDKLDSCPALKTSVEAILWCISIRLSGKYAAYLWPQENAFTITYRTDSNTWNSLRVNDDRSYLDTISGIEQAFDCSLK